MKWTDAISGFYSFLSSRAVRVSPSIHSLNVDPHTTPLASSSLFLLADTAAGGGYSPASYYTSLGLFVISVPGLWSLIKRPVKSKIVKKTLVMAEEGEGKKKAPNLVAGEILSFFTRNNFVVADRGDAITAVRPEGGT
ncbi:protein COFACTOR ASSEMBLY OF COMPLEX C SUBUNIT B CCB1, chloroplastic-like [Malania oleifera]|uniref:protein COFACTOR ASSEMBLY OF COMPLEX C SUBUNIT B CCB1, chloroplastic-like n=1 Tax=Malania oleifera TaxID=397392 RepID=UPI0025ADFFAB|nr:protein COFACTOR ASSEMBLY OF COMPLEX C SUBUNIT B CCB1, chloroplastic-like [Malania oleifera]